MRPSSNYMFLLIGCIFFACYVRYSSFERADPYKCTSPMSTGEWLDPPKSQRTETPFQKWQPNGCSLRSYSSKKISTCLDTQEAKDAVFIGDSTVREVFWAFSRKLNATKATAQSAQVNKHADIVFRHDKTTVEFIWDPFLNSSLIPEYLKASKPGAETAVLDNPMNKALVVVGGGLWFAKDSSNPAEDFRSAMDKIALSAEPPPADHHPRPGSNRIYFLPVQSPYYPNLDADHTASLQPEDVDQMNDFLADLPLLHGLDILTSSLLMVDNLPDAYQDNGLHVIKSVADRQADILLNVRCNNGIKQYPYDGTCCYEYPLGWTQTIAIALGIVGLIVVVWIEAQGFIGIRVPRAFENVNRHLPAVRPMLVMFAALSYCYIADRTHLFNKIMKQYDDHDFFLFCAAFIIAGVVTVRVSAPPKGSQEKPVDADQPFLSRDQTDEWKGWMQALILAYHYTGGSKVLWIYKIIRLLVAGYLFMSGYGHAAYFYQKSDFSLKRVVAVNFRLNMLSLLLPWAMDTDYLFYYFAPLVTYWYFVVYFTMRIKSDWNHQLSLFLAKVVSAAFITTIVHTQPILFQPFFTAINFIFGTSWDVREWLFRVSLDQYIVYIGMIVAVLYIRSSKPPAPPPPPQEPFATTSHKAPGFSPHLRQESLYLADVACILVYAYASSTQATKSSSNALHTYISPLPILAFIHLRNCTKWMRNHYSGIYAQLGRMSLETFVLQYHIWLAADTKGLLSTGLFGAGGMSNSYGLIGGGMGFARWADCLLLGTVFIWVSSKVATATGSITTVAVKALFG